MANIIFYEDIISKVGNIRNTFQLFLLVGLTFRYLKIDSISFLFMTLKTDFKCDWIDTMTTIGLSFNESCGGLCRNNTENKCLLSINSSLSSRLIKCTKWKYANDLTIISEFNLVCDEEKWINIIQGSLWVGMVFGMVLGPIADRFGRRVTIITSNYLDVICSALMIFANGPWMLIILRFISGFLFAESKISLINFQELSNIDSRVIAGTCWWLTWVIGYSLMSLLAYLFPYWRHLQIALVILISVVCFQPLYVPESPRWLLSRNKYDEAQKTMNWLCKMNKVESVSLKNIEIQNSTDLSIMKMIKNSAVISRIVFTLISWTSIAMIYYGISLNVNFATENPYISTFIMGVAEFPSIPLGFLLSKYLGYRIGLYILVSITSILIVIIPWILEIFILRAVLAFIGKVCITSAYSIIIIYTGELFPTPIRNTGMSFNCLIKFTGMIIPYINDLKNVHFSIPAAIFGIFGIVLCLVVVPFPETKGAPLIQRLEDMPKLKWKIFKRPSLSDVSPGDNSQKQFHFFIKNTKNISHHSTTL